MLNNPLSRESDSLESGKKRGTSSHSIVFFHIIQMLSDRLGYREHFLFHLEFYLFHLEHFLLSERLGYQLKELKFLHVILE